MRFPRSRHAMASLGAALPLSVALGTALAIAVSVGLSACSNETLKAPKSDQNFDDPDEPPKTGTIGAVDASTAETAADVVVPCTSTADCPSSFTCYFAVDQGCAATAGTCIVYLQSTGCTTHTRCGCNGAAPLRECSPEGYASAPVSRADRCGDAAASDDAAASTD